MSNVVARTYLIAALVLAAFVVAGCGSSDDSGADDADGVAAGVDDEPTPGATDADVGDEASDGEASDSEAPGEEPDTGGTEQAPAPRDPSLPFAVDAVHDADAEPYLLWFSAFDAGTYRTGALGTPMSFTTTERLNTQINGGGTFVLSDVASRGPDDRDLVFMRVAHLSDPTAPNTPIADQTFWPVDDFSGWLENLHDGVIATEPVETSINGLSAIRVDLEISDEIECGWLPGFCVGLAENNGEETRALNRGAKYRVWMVDQGDEDPLLITAAIARDEQLPWFERADAVLDTVAFGEIAPNPVQWLTPGPAQLNALGGIEADIPENVSELTNGRPRLINMWAGRGFAIIPVTDEPGLVMFTERPHDTDAVPLTTTDDVVTELTAGGAQLSELDSTTVGGTDARVFDVTTDDPGAILLRFGPLDLADPVFGWDAPAAGRIWLIDHPDRGLMMISTHAFDVDNLDVMLPTVNELGEAIVQSLTFVD